MPYIDDQGIEHPATSDEVTAAGLEHIANCSICKPQGNSSQIPSIALQQVHEDMQALFNEEPQWHRPRPWPYYFSRRCKTCGKLIVTHPPFKARLIRRIKQWMK